MSSQNNLFDLQQLTEKSEFVVIEIGFSFHSFAGYNFIVFLCLLAL